MQEPLPRKVKIHHALIPVGVVIITVFCAIVLFDTGPQVPLVFGCLAAGLVAVYLGYTWEDILDGMIQGITDSLEAILILLMIGMLVGAWIASGTVPTLIAYGLHVVTAKTFLPAAMGICVLTAFAIGSWGTVGTMGLALMGIGISLKIPVPLVAGAVISGSYMGEVISPLSDATNLAAAVAGDSVLQIVKKLLPTAVAAGLLTLILYAAAGMRYGVNGAETVSDSISSMLEGLNTNFQITPLSLLPLILVLICILRKLPAIPSMLFGAMAGMAEAMLLQGADFGSVLSYAYSGYVCESGNTLMDTLFTAGGMEDMLEAICVILIAMAFGGIMKKTKQMEALVQPVVSRVRKTGTMLGLTVLTCAAMNVILPDQYLGISMPGQMYKEDFQRRGLTGKDLGAVLLGGGAVMSPLIPWNTCGMYCSAILQVSPAKYARYAWYGILLPVMVIAAGLISPKKNSRRSK